MNSGWWKKPHCNTVSAMNWLLIFLCVFAVSASVAAGPSAGEQAKTFGFDLLNDIAAMAGGAVLASVLWALLGFALALAGSIYLWRWMRDRGWLDAPWGWYRYFKWVWPTLIIGCLTLGGSCSLGTWGAGNSINNDLREGKIVKNAVINLYDTIKAVRGDQNATDLNATTLEQDLTKGLKNLEPALAKAQKLEGEQLEKLKKELEGKAGSSPLKKMLVRELMGAMENSLKEQYADNEAVKKYNEAMAAKEQGGESAMVQFVKKELLSGVTSSLISSVDGFVWGTVFSILGLALGIPFIPLGIFCLVRWLILRNKPPADDEEGSPPVLDADPA